MALNPVEKLRKQKQKQLLLKQKKQRRVKNKEKFTKLTREEVEQEYEKLKRKPKSNVDEKDVQRLKSLEKRLLEEKKTTPKNDIGPTAALNNGGVKRSSNNGNKIAYDDYVGDSARDAEDSVYYHPTLNPLGKPPPGKPQKYVQRKRGGKVDAGMALPAPEKRKRKRDGEENTESSSGESSGESSDEDEEEGGGNIFTKMFNVDSGAKAKKEKKVPGPPKGPPPPLLEEGEDASEDGDEEKYTDVVVPPPVGPPPGWMPPAPSGSPPPSDEEEEEENVEEIVIDGIVVPPPPPDDTDEDDDEEEDEEEKEVEKVETTAPPPPPPPVGIDVARTINKPPMFGNTLEMKAQSHMASISRPPPPSHQPMRAANIYQRPPPIHSMNNARGNNPPQHFFSPAAPMAVKKKSQEQATIRGEATTIAAPSQNPALQKLVPAHLRVQRGGDQNRKKKVNPAPTVVKVSKEKKDEKGKDDQYLNFLDDVATLGAFQE